MRLTTGSDLHVEIWGQGTPVVLVHGSLATGAAEWAAQRPLAEHGYRLMVPDLRGYGASPAAHGEDYLADADDIAELLGAGAHLVAHSYGGIGALIAAARRPEAVRSLTVLEPPIAQAASASAEWRTLLEEVSAMWRSDLNDRDWVIEFLTAIGSDPNELPHDVLEAALSTVPLLRNGRLFADAVIPFDAIRDAKFPKLVISGGHHAGFDAMSVDLADRIGAAYRVIQGCGHEIQFTGGPFNDALTECWTRGLTSA
jgi:pimeloyl-ACP methyl ester carboxylesterase